MKALVVVNPRAGRQDPVGIAKRAVAHLSERGADAELVETTHAHHATEIARAQAGGLDLLVVAGGDGTLREALAGMGEDARSCVLAQIPVGNANVVARELDVPLDPAGAIALLTTGEARTIDVGVVHDGSEARLFLAMVGVGFDAMVTRGVDFIRHTYLGGGLYRHGLSDVIYGVCALPALLRLVPRRFALLENDVPLVTDAPTILVSNTATYAKGWSMTPEARIESGRLHWVAAHHAAAPFVLAHFLAAARRRAVGPRLARYGDGEHLRITSDAAFRWQVDGDPMPPASHLDIEVRPAYARLLAPPLTDRS